MLRQLQDEILKLKKERNVSILAHTYQTPDILEIADFTGDSFALSRKAATIAEKEVLMCGVRFMAETVKLLSPEKRVVLVSPEAGCPMAEQFDRRAIEEYRASHPDAVVVAYVNTTADLKCVSDICVTSASALRIVSQIPDDREILFIPDCNLGAYVAAAFPSKKITLWKGGCPVHGAVTVGDVLAAKAAHPKAAFLVHPECSPEVTAHADFIGSTSAIMDYAKESNGCEFIIGTDNSIVSHLQNALPEKRFYPLTKHLICPDMRLTTLSDVLLALRGEAGEVIELDAATQRDARRCIDRMIEMG